MSIFEKKKKVPSAEEYGSGRIYDYSTPEGRVSTASWLFEQAKDERTVRENEWVKFNDYYNFAHDAAKETAAAHGVTVCDCYAKWKAMAAAGVNVTELLANKVNHPIRELTGLFAYSLLETMLS